MKMNFAAKRLTLQRDITAREDFYAAYRRLSLAVFGPDFVSDVPTRSWCPMAYFTDDGLCVSALEVGFLPLLLNGSVCTAAAIRLVATDPAWRGRGLSTSLMREALADCEGRMPAATLLYAATPEIYERFGFGAQLQYAFVGPAPAAASGQRGGRRLDLGNTRDRTLVADLVTNRAPVSRSCALLTDATLFVANVARDDALRLAYVEDHDALVVFESDEDKLLIVDIVASSMPTLAAVVGALDPQASHVKCLFSPDQLDWRGEPQAEDTGLMIRGSVPPAMMSPFMLSPTSEF